VTITTVHADLFEYDLGAGTWDCCAAIFFHMPSAKRHEVHRRVAASLRPGGYLVLEAYTPKQLTFRTGGPPVADMLQTLATLHEDFPDLEFLVAVERERRVVEGSGHTGDAAVVQLLARKPDPMST